MLAIRSIVDRYRIDAHVVDGAAASVYKVTHVWLHTPMVLKHLLPGLPPDVAHAMWEEGRIQASHHHQNIVAVHDALMIEDRPALIMELVDGPDLADWIDARATPPLDEALTLFRGILLGMEEAHRAGLVHRDLKPENVLLAMRDGRPPIAKVTDFGFAKQRRGTARSSFTLSGHYSLIGTPEYMAPEQLKDPGAVDHRADVFSLGAILYELATGEVAFEGEELGDVLPLVLRGHFTPPRQVRPEIPQALEDLIRSMLEVNRDRRMPTCTDALRAVDRLGLAREG